MKTITSKTLILLPSAAIYAAGLGDLDDAGLVYETYADARAHLADLISETESERDDALIERIITTTSLLENPTDDQVAEAESHRCSPNYARNGHSVGVRAGDLSSAHRVALDGGEAVLTSGGAVIRARRAGNGRIYYTVRLQPGYRWSDRGSYSKNPTPVRA